MYFNKLMHMVTSTHLEISTDTMHQYIVGLATLKMTMHMLSDKFYKGSISVYSDAMKARVHFQHDATIERTYTITFDQDWHQFSTIEHREDVEELVLPQISKC